MTTYTIDELEALFSESIDDTIKPFVFGDREYPASSVLKQMDPVSWKEEFLNWMDAEEITEITDRNAPDAELYAYVRDIEDEYENSHASAIATAEEYEEWRGDQLYDLQNDGY